MNSSAFKNSLILSNFLQYIVSRTLEGNENILKEYVIATDVLHKETNFDPQKDAIVRIHAGRLRKALMNYYQNDGANNSVIISMPKGRYIPRFELSKEKKGIQKTDIIKDGGQAVSKPVVVVIPFKQFQSNVRINVICSGLCQDLSIELTRFKEIGVISSFSAQAATERVSKIDDLATHLGVDYMITGACVQEGNQIKVSAELNSVRQKQIVWAEQYFIEDFENNTIQDYSTIIRKIIAATCGFFGSIYRDTLSEDSPKQYGHLYAIYWHNRYHREFSEEAFHGTMKAVELGLQNNPTNALLLAFKGELLLNLLIFDLQDGVDYLSIGTQLVRQSISVDPNNQHAYQVMAWANLLKHDKQALLKSIDTCIALNPQNVNYLGEMGFGYICAGEYEKGFELMSDCIALNPYYQWNLNVGFCFYHLMNDDFEEAFIWAEKICRPALLWDPILRIASLGLQQKGEAAKSAISELFVLKPKFSERALIIIETFILDIPLQSRLLQGLMQAGVEIDAS